MYIHDVTTEQAYFPVILHYFQCLDVSCCVNCSQLIKPCQTFAHVHGQNGVTDIRCNADSAILYSCGRNGHYCQFTVNHGINHQLQLISSNRVSIYLIVIIIIIINIVHNVHKKCGKSKKYNSDNSSDCLMFII